MPDSSMEIEDGLLLLDTRVMMSVEGNFECMVQTT